MRHEKETDMEDCEFCDGIGYHGDIGDYEMPVSRCRECKGDGRVEKSKKVENASQS